MDLKQEVQNHMNILESNLNYILEHIRDAEEVGGNSFTERKHEVKRHALNAKRAFDWLDNFAIIKAPDAD